MKEIKNYNTQHIRLPGFGVIEVSEQPDGSWHLDLMPRNFDNSPDKLSLEINMKNFGDKYFVPLEKAREYLNGQERMYEL